MKTDELINFLGTSVKPVKVGRVVQVLIGAVAGGAVAAFCVALSEAPQIAPPGRGL